MKKIFYLMFCFMAVLSFASCSDDDDDDDVAKVCLFDVQLMYPETSGVAPAEGVEVTMKNVSNSVTFKKPTNAEGLAKFALPVGLYEVSATDKRVVGAKVLVFNGLNSSVTVDETSTSIQLPLEVSMGGSIVIKELYIGGCQADDGSGRFGRDQYVILYNNSSEKIDMTNFALAMVNPFNSTGNNKDYENGKLFYDGMNVTPAGVAVWYFTQNVALEGGQQMVISLTGAIDHTKTYSQSVDLSKSEYYCLYDMENFDNTKYYPAPSEAIPTSHYLKCYKYGIGNAWPLSQICPAFFIFNPEGTTLKAFVDDPSSTHNYGGSENMPRKMVPDAWIVDGIEVFKEGADNNMKRFTASVDAGYVNLTNGLSRTLYRNVDKAATEAIEANKGKLVYNYNTGVAGNTDPSGIDAEASIKNGARIIYQDTNNSSIDFHQRAKASIKD